MRVFSVQETTIDTVVATAKFACDLSQCKGACCTMPGPRGAPLMEEEIEEIEKAFPLVRKYLNAEHLNAIDERGLVDRSNGGATTPCVSYRACVFVTYEGGIAKCAFEKAYFNKEIGWRKPLSCHLFPIRVDRGFHDHLRYESISECSPAVQQGKEGNFYLSHFLRDALVRLYDEAWYDEFKQACIAERQKLTAVPSK